MDDRTTANLIGAAFRHTSSRALDPQLHTHFTLFNATFDPVEKRWKALQSSRMYDAIRYGTSVYRNELAKRLHGLGYATRQTAHGFEVAGVEPKIIERFSKRSKQRDQAVAREEKRLNRRLTKDEISNVVHKSRPKKLKDASENEVRAQQLDELSFFEKRALKHVVAEANGVAWKPQTLAEQVNLGQAVQYAQAHVFARQSVAPEHALLEAALIKGYGQVELPDVKAAFRQNREFVRVGTEVSTRTILNAELKLLRTVNEGIGTVAPLAPRFEGPVHLGHDQRSALGHVAFSQDRVTGFQGLAGTGKTTTLKELARVVTDAGHASVFLAPTTGAVDVLRKDGFRDALTLAKLLTDEQAQAKLGPRSVLVLDEAGAVGTADMQRLFDLALTKGARVVRSGDTGQHASVAQGDALRLIEAHSGYRYAVLGEIRRQTKESFRHAVKLAAEQEPGAAFKLLQTEGAVVEGLTDQGQLYSQAAKAYLAATDAGKTALLVSPTWGEIAAVTEVLREQLKERGNVTGKEETRHVFDSLGWTDAQKGLVTHYEPGLQVRFVRKTEQFKAGEIAEVADVQGRTVTLRAPGGQSVAWHPSRSPASFEVGEARELAIASGDWLLLQANAKAGAQSFTNGERVQVASIGRDGIGLKDGRTLPPSYRTFNYGYAVTSHAAQGKTVDVGLFVASSRSFAAVSRESFYVGISRAREQVTVFTDDAATLSHRVQDAHTRKAALELAGLREALQKHGLFQPREDVRKKETVKPAHRQHERAPRITRALRALRVQRRAPVVAVQRWTQDLRRWVGERMGVTQPVEALTPMQRIQQSLRASAALPPTQRPDEPRQSRGIRM